MFAPTNLAEDAITALREGGDSLVCNDHLHPNDRGHAKIAETFVTAARLGDP